MTVYTAHYVNTSNALLELLTSGKQMHFQTHWNWSGQAAELCVCHIDLLLSHFAYLLVYCFVIGDVNQSFVSSKRWWQIQAL